MKLPDSGGIQRRILWVSLDDSRWDKPNYELKQSVLFEPDEETQSSPTGDMKYEIPKR